MELNVEENLIEITQRDTLHIEKELDNYLETSEGQKIKADIELLKDMGFDKKIINKVYILLRPENIERAIDYMTEINGIYQHDFIQSSNVKEKSLCFICKKKKQFHLNYIPDDLLNEDNLINIEQDNNNIIQEDNKNENLKECEVCYEEISEEDMKLNSIPCGHFFCNHCWFNYLKTLIIESKVDDIQCMNHGCKKIMTEEFILNHIHEDKNLIEKYKRFIKRSQIIKDKNKKLCPNPNCESFLEKSDLTKYVECENGHKYCFECLKPPHGSKSCDYELETQFMKWKKNKRVKRCPRCQIYTEKNEGCNHMTCASCKYQWCWLCEGLYTYGHYESGKCFGHQFTKADSLEEIKKMNKNRPNNLYNQENRFFGIHRIFTCFYRPIRNQVDLDEYLCVKYLCIILFWLFGFVAIFVAAVLQHGKIFLNNNCLDTFFVVIVFVSAFILAIPYQIALTCITTPFIFICFIYHHFFENLLSFFAIGET